MRGDGILIIICINVSSITIIFFYMYQYPLSYVVSAGKNQRAGTTAVA